MSGLTKIVRHSAVYGVGQVLSRIASVLMLPVYTRCLVPADYGLIAILDFTAALFGIVIGSGMSTAASRFHFDTDDQRERDAVWWTALLFVIAIATAVVVPAFVLRGWLADLTLGVTVQRRALYFALMLGAMWCGAVAQIGDVYLQVRKWSILYVVMALGQMCLNIGLNLYFLLKLDWGVQGLLLGNLIATAAGMVFRLAVVTTSCRVSWSRETSSKLWRFGAPIAVSSLLALLMHQMDRYLLRVFLDLNDVGLYSFAYAIAQGINTLILTPFSAIWMVTVCEVGSRPEAPGLFSQTFEYFVYGLAMLMFAVSLAARPAIAVIATEAYLPAADLIPIVCLGYLLFSMHTHFKVPAILSKRSIAMVPVFATAAAVNAAANVILVPFFGTFGAAWATVITFAVFSFVGLACYRKITVYHYPLTRTLSVVGGISLSYAVLRASYAYFSTDVLFLVCCTVVWVVWACLLALPLLRRRLGRLSEAATA